ncbi:amidohydrolase family protein [uncultured Phenylobacterium sp.]|uniref:amidohydrolase family protein n=1 Tax=uncultured Phenylobacterium sp. TaxID=349273 RepID=UPI0025FDAE20|nr:amidohydrolase family protein [uncultured Phenylobacterium sp.]
MTYAGERVIFDADSHLMELPDFLTAHADPAMRDRMPPMGSLATGQFNPAAHIGKAGHDAATVERLMALGDQITHGPKWHDALGSFSGTERAAALDLLGFRRQVVFSSFCARPIFEASPDVAYAAARAHNRAMAAFCNGDRRLIGVAMVPLDDPEQAMAEIAYAHSLGLGAVWIAASAPGGRSPGHADHEPIWAMLAERRLPFILHVGSAPLSIEPAWMNDGRDRPSARGGAEVIGSKDLTVIHHAAVRFISTLVLDGVLERHPSLRGGIIELGAGWVPDMIRRLDHAASIWAKSEPHLAEMSRPPSEQIRAQLRFTPYPFEDVAAFVRESAPELYLFSSDYPHAEGGRDPIGRFERSLAGADEAVKRRFYADNFADLYPGA